MKKLGQEAFGRSRRFLLHQARPLERSLFQHRFEGASVEGVFTELARFQNPDGGFGHALEPDLRTPRSSALATGIGLRMLDELGCRPDHPMVSKAVSYLLATFEQDDRVWRVVPHDTDHHPHAPWWDNQKGSLAQVFDGFRIIPRALLVSLLHRYHSLVPPEWLASVTEETVHCIETEQVLGSGGGSDLEYAIHLAETPDLPQQYADRLRSRIRQVIPTVVVREPTQWGTYCLTPLRAVLAPQSLGADLIPDELQAHLDYEILHQTAHGTWEPTWSWGGTYPEVWAQARLEWCGVLTLKTLTQLDAFGRIEP